MGVCFPKSIKNLIGGSRLDVGLFSVRTQKHLPAAVCSYLIQTGLRTGISNTLKLSGCAFAPVPLYVPPSVMIPAEEKRYRDLEIRISDANQCGNFRTTGKVLIEEQKTIGSICAALNTLSQTPMQ